MATEDRALSAIPVVDLYRLYSSLVSKYQPGRNRLSKLLLKKYDDLPQKAAHRVSRSMLRNTRLLPNNSSVTMSRYEPSGWNSRGSSSDASPSFDAGREPFQSGQSEWDGSHGYALQQPYRYNSNTNQGCNTTSTEKNDSQDDYGDHRSASPARNNRDQGPIGKV
jgi:hypothetical protein